MTFCRRTSVYLCLLLLVILYPSRLFAVVDVHGTIDTDTTWTAADIIRLTGVVRINPGAHLTILPGTVVQGELTTGFQVQGTMTAIGDNANYILFTSSADTVGGAPVAGSWGGLYIDGGTAEVRRCTVRYADHGIQAHGGALEVDSCLVENFLSRGINIDGGSAVPRTVHSITNTTARQNDASLIGTGTGIHITRMADVTITRCQTDHCRIGMTFESAGTLNAFYHVSECDITQNVFIGIYSYASG